MFKDRNDAAAVFSLARNMMYVVLSAMLILPFLKVAKRVKPPEAAGAAALE